MGLLETALGFFQRLRLSPLLPGLDVAVEGAALICTREHMYVSLTGIPDPQGPPHIDVEMDVWNKGHHPVSLIEVWHATAKGQALEDGSHFGTSRFQPLTLEPAGLKNEVYFALSPRDDEALVAQAGDQVEFSFRLGRNGRDRRVKLLIRDKE
ncbi:MAG: hypothetical protein WD096_02555 [Actinomycetota bacterium]